MPAVVGSSYGGIDGLGIIRDAVTLGTSSELRVGDISPDLWLSVQDLCRSTKGDHTGYGPVPIGAEPSRWIAGTHQSFSVARLPLAPDEGLASVASTLKDIGG